MDLNATLIGQAIAMTVFVVFCMKYVWPPMLKAIDERRTAIADGLAAGEKAQADLNKAKQDADVLVADARTQALGIVEQANKRAQTLVDEAKQDGVKERERQVAAAAVEIEQSTHKAREALRTKVADLCLETAEKVLDREIDAKSHKDLLDQLAAQI